MASVNMSLDDIIALNRKKPSSGGGSRPGARRGNFRRNDNGFKGRPARSGYVDLDADEPATGGQTVLRGNPNKMVRLNISNLAPTVVSDDLEELFSNYNFESATVHYNERGESCCTGDVVLSKKDADRACRDYAGVALDGQVMKLLLVDSSSTDGMSSRLDFGRRRSGGTSGGVRKGNERRSFGSDFKRNDRFRRDNRPARRERGGGRGPVKSEAELDAELDAYMAKRK